MINFLRLLACFVVVCVPLSAHAFGIEIAGGAWRQSPSGQLGYEAQTSSDILDLETNLKYGGETRFFGRVNIDMPLFIPNIYLMATPMEFDGTGTKALNFNFGDATIGTDFYSKLSLDHYDVALYYGIPLLETATFDTLNIDVGINVRIFDLKATISDRTGTGQSDTESATVPVPMVFLGLQYRPIEAFAVEAEGRGISIGSNKAYSLIGRLRWNALGPFFVAAGYRYDKFDIDEDDVIVDVDFSGPFAEVGFEF